RRAAFMHDFVRFALTDLEQQEGMEQTVIELRDALAALDKLMRVLLTDREVLLRVARSGDQNLVKAADFKQRATDQGLHVEIFDAFANDKQLKLALGFKRRGEWVRAKVPHLFELLRMLIRRLITGRKSVRT
ncbi:MAG: hypothetical protein P9M14_03015, partial [Candidatus Alcyoniella australis]|nr:hypothetical protein [Candidatus Alcyoniella australis]